jgi:hypothetical protein
VLQQLVGADLVPAPPDPDASCVSSTKPGWCYVTGKPAGACGQAVLFSVLGNPGASVTVSLKCSPQAFAPDGG